MNQKKTSPQFNEIECWALARVVNGQTIPEDLPIRNVVYRLTQDLAYISLEWRAATLQETVGNALARQVGEFANKPMPVYEVGPGIAYSPTPAYGSSNSNPLPGYNPLPAPPPVVTRPPREHLILADELKRLPTPKYALAEYPIYQQCLNALVGPSGAGKSFIAVDIAGRLAIAGAVVIYIAGEGLFGYSARWEVWKDFRNLSGCPNLIFYDNPVNFMDKDEIARFMDEIAPKKPAMVIVDTVARCMVGADENSTRDMGMFVGTCDKLIHTLGCGVLGVHHTGKDGKMRGNSSLFGACDSVLFLRRDQQDITIFNSLEMGGKNKNNQEADPMRLTLLPRSATADNKLFESAVLVDSYKVTADTLTAQLKAREMTILETIESFEAGLKIDQICDATSIPKSSVYRSCSKLKKDGYISEADDRYAITQDGRDVLFNR